MMNPMLQAMNMKKNKRMMPNKNQPEGMTRQMEIRPEEMMEGMMEGMPMSLRVNGKISSMKPEGGALMEIHGIEHEENEEQPKKKEMMVRTQESHS